MLATSGAKKGSIGSVGGYSKGPSSGTDGSSCPLSMKTIAIPERRHGTLAPKTARADLGLARCASGTQFPDRGLESRHSLNPPKPGVQGSGHHHHHGLSKHPSVKELKTGQGGRWIAHKHAASTFGSGAMTVRNKERDEPLVTKEVNRAATGHHKYSIVIQRKL